MLPRRTSLQHLGHLTEEQFRAEFQRFQSGGMLSAKISEGTSAPARPARFPKGQGAKAKAQQAPYSKCLHNKLMPPSSLRLETCLQVLQAHCPVNTRLIRTAVLEGGRTHASHFNAGVRSGSLGGSCRFTQDHLCW